MDYLLITFWVSRDIFYCQHAQKYQCILGHNNAPITKCDFPAPASHENRILFWKPVQMEGTLQVDFRWRVFSPSHAASTHLQQDILLVSFSSSPFPELLALLWRVLQPSRGNIERVVRTTTGGESHHLPTSDGILLLLENRKQAGGGITVKWK